MSSVTKGSHVSASSFTSVSEDLTLSADVEADAVDVEADVEHGDATSEGRQMDVARAIV